MINQRSIRGILPFLVLLLLLRWPLGFVHSDNTGIAVPETSQPTSAGFPITSNLAATPEFNPLVPKTKEFSEQSTMEEFPFRLYVSPEDRTILALATRVKGVRDAYRVAVEWVYVSEQKLNQLTDKWLSPHEFLTNTPHYPGNPLPGERVSDCEEQANTLASVIRAEGVQPEEVRVAIGEVKFGDQTTGHAWIELFTDGQWLALDPGSGPYWDDKTERLIQRQGLSFDYYVTHTFPVVQVWAYYNDIYYLNPGDGSGNAPSTWY